MRIPVLDAGRVDVRFASLSERDRFGERWRYAALDPCEEGFWEANVDALGLPDGVYEYEFIIDGRHSEPVPDPYAKEISRFGGYRGLLHIRDGHEWAPTFDWHNELPRNVSLPENNRIVIYEMPLRWMEGDQTRQVGLGTFEEVVFAHLDRLAGMGINCIELLPVQDSPDTLNWGYGTRFFFAPDFDMGGPVDLKWFIKRCHQRGIRVLLDVVMNHAKECPLGRLAWRRYFVDPRDESGRNAWGGELFRFRDPVDGRHWARLLHCDMARYWIDEYHVDGFRIDEFNGIDNWEFVQQFRDCAWDAFRRRFPDRPFIVIAEDSVSRSAAARDDVNNPGGRRVVDAIWNFSYRDELRRLLLNELSTDFGQPARRERITALVSGGVRWDDWSKRFEAGFGDMAQAVGYITSHDVEKDGERRFMNHVLSSLVRYFGRGDGSFENVRTIVDGIGTHSPNVPDGTPGLWWQALDRVRSGYALLMTSVDIPMLLAGEEFADVHDTDHHAWQLKMTDPVNWSRRDYGGHRELTGAVSDLIWLRHGHPALHRNEVEFFHFHPTIDENEGRRVFAYCRTDGRRLGSGGQVVVVANLGGDDYPVYQIPWPWTGRWSERGALSGGGSLQILGGGSAALSLGPFQVRVFETY